MISIGEFMKLFRKKHNMTQKELAEELGISRKGMRNIENNRSLPRLATVEAFEEYFKVKLGRYFQTYAEKIEMASYKKMQAMLKILEASEGEEDEREITRAYQIACELKSSEFQKNTDCWQAYYLVKAQFYRMVIKDRESAYISCLKGLKFEAFVDYQQGRGLIIDSLLPSLYGMKLIRLLAEVLTELNELNQAVEILEKVLQKLAAIHHENEILQNYFHRTDILLEWSLIEKELAKIFYAQGHFEKALLLVNSSLAKSIFFCYQQDEVYWLKFQILCALSRQHEALELLPDLLWLVHWRWKQRNPRKILEFQKEMSKKFPELKLQINKAFSLYQQLFQLSYQHWK